MRPVTLHCLVKQNRETTRRTMLRAEFCSFKKTEAAWRQEKVLLRLSFQTTDFIRQDKHTTFSFLFWLQSREPSQECNSVGMGIRCLGQCSGRFAQRMRWTVCSLLRSPGRRSRTRGRWIVQPSGRWRGRWTPSLSAGARHHCKITTRRTDTVKNRI